MKAKERRNYIEMATQYAQQQGWEIAKFRVDAVVLEDGLCWVRFAGRDSLPGNHFSVSIDVAMHQVITLVPGR